MTTDLLNLGAKTGTEPSDIFWNGAWLPRHDSGLLIHIGNIYNDIVPQEAGKCNKKVLIPLYFSTVCWLLNHLPKLRSKSVNSLNY